MGNKTFKNVADLKQEIQKIWDEIPAVLCRKLIMSMKDRVEAVISADGYQTKY